MNRRTALLVDVLAAVAFAVPAVVDNSARPLSAVAVAIWVGSLALRSTSTDAMAAVFTVGLLAYTFVPDALTREPFVSTLVILFCLGHDLVGRRRLALAVVLVSVVMAHSALSVHLDLANTLVTPFVIVGGPMLAGALLRTSRDRSAELRRLTEALEAERAAHQQAAVAEERNQIARELHDVISHSVTVMVVQAGAAEQQLPMGAPARVQVEEVRRAGKEALAELRRQLGVLRHERVSPSMEPAAPR